MVCSIPPPPTGTFLRAEPGSGTPLSTSFYTIVWDVQRVTVDVGRSMNRKSGTTIRRNSANFTVIQYKIKTNNHRLFE